MLPDLVFRFHGLKIVTRNCPLLVTNPHSASEHKKRGMMGREHRLLSHAVRITREQGQPVTDRSKQLHSVTTSNRP